MSQPEKIEELYGNRYRGDRIYWETERVIPADRRALKKEVDRLAALNITDFNFTSQSYRDSRFHLTAGGWRYMTGQERIERTRLREQFKREASQDFVARYFFEDWDPQHGQFNAELVKLQQSEAAEHYLTEPELLELYCREFVAPRLPRRVRRSWISFRNFMLFPLGLLPFWLHRCKLPPWSDKGTENMWWVNDYKERLPSYNHIYHCTKCGRYWEHYSKGLSVVDEYYVWRQVTPGRLCKYWGYFEQNRVPEHQTEQQEAA